MSTKLIDRIRQHQREQKPFFSFEFFPPKTEPGLYNLYSRIDRMASLEPAFIDITWGAGGSTSETTLELSRNVQSYFGVDVMMHLTCMDMSIERLGNVLLNARSSGVKNIMALRGDLPPGKTRNSVLEGKFRYASDLISFIRSEFSEDFSIGVGGYPEGHPEGGTKDQCIQHLKQKVDAGADFVVTQLFFDLDEYEKFLERAARAGISCPIIPGILPIVSYERFQRFAEFAGVKIPESILKKMNEIRTDDEKVRSYGVEQCTEMCERLLKLGAPGLHFYTLNLEASVTEILDNLGFLKDCRERRALPWRPSTQDNRRTEEVRPIFWSNRPRSYLARTANWDDFPNGRWGSSFSPTYGELSDYYMFRKFSDPTLQNLRRKQWGAPESTEDVATVFAKFCDGSIDRLPWCELPVQAETGRIAERLIKLNREGYLTINSQPQVNGAHSSDPTVGWGGAGGYVFQKAYLEFFCSRQKLMTLIERMTQLPTVTYHAVNAQGEKFSSFQERNVSALTWGVFPGKEIVQPTVVDSESFMIWKDEAFDLWVSEWRALYEESSRSWEVLTSIHDEYFLVNVVEHDFVNGDLYRIFPEMF